MTLRLGLLLALCALTAQASVFHEPEKFPSLRDLIKGRSKSLIAPHGAARISEGKDASPGQFPHQVGIYIDMSAFCGGALVAAKWVLTAGSCVSSSDLRPRYTTYLGGLSINLPSEKGRIAVTTTVAYVPQDFDLTTRTNDIALIQLPREVTSTDVIKPISLPPESYANREFSGQKFLVSGWGYNKDTSLALSPNLKYTDVIGLTNDMCALIYGYMIAHDGILCCAGADRQSPCQGDTGGALMMTDEDTKQKIIVGVNSFTSSEGCEKSRPTGHTRVVQQLKWIKSVMG